MSVLQTGDDYRAKAAKRQAAYMEKMKELGFVRMCVWIPPEGRERIKQLATELQQGLSPAPSPVTAPPAGGKGNHWGSDPEAFEQAVELTGPDSVIKELRGQGKSWGQVADELNKLGYRTARGRKWGESNLCKYARRRGLT